MDVRDFVGMKIEKTLINQHRDAMYWKIDGKWYTLDAIGDCCSRSWYEHCDNADALKDATVLEYDYTSEEDQFNDSAGDEYIQVNMMKFKTTKGHCTIEFRNESNGYYSGWTEVNDVTELANEIEAGIVGSKFSRFSDKLKEMEDF